MAKKSPNQLVSERVQDIGPAWFQKMFERSGHHDDWGVTCVYDYAAWRLCKAAMRRQRKSFKAKPGVGDV